MESKGQKNGITANKINTANKKEENNTSTTKTINKATSINQQGGITANEVNIYNEKSPVPPKDLMIQVLNSINPKILQLKKRGVTKVCVMSQSHKISKLLEIEDVFKSEKLLLIKSNGSEMSGNSNKNGDCINDVQDGKLYGFILTFLDDFD